MTTGQLILMIGFYLAAFVAVAYFTRANVRRIVGVLAGGAVFGFVALLALALGEARGWWRLPKTGSSHFQSLLWLGFVVSCGPTYLILWRVVRRFGGHGLAVCVLASAIIGPPRDYWITAMFPAWMTFAPGIAPVLADATVYALLVLVGHAVMRLVTGPAQGDLLARQLSGADKKGPSSKPTLNRWWPRFSNQYWLAAGPSRRQGCASAECKVVGRPGSVAGKIPAALKFT